MTDQVPAPHSPGYRLRTFGTLTLSGPGDATTLGLHGHHRRRLALLAVLAAAGDRGWSRDQLLLFFWPDSSQSRARHSLDQLLYALRASLGETLFSGANPVRLNPDIVRSDVEDFTNALQRDELEVAVAEYRGPFLDGFYLSAAPEFERWVESERARYAASYSRALERLAQLAESAQDHAAAVKWWRAAADNDRLSSTNATGVIRSLMNVGDHPAALRFAEQYESLVARELGTSVGPAVAALVSEVRAESQTEPLALGRTVVPAATESWNAAAHAPADTANGHKPQRPTRRPSLVATAAATVGLTIAAIAILAPVLSRPARSRSIAVIPFVNVGQKPDDAPLVDGLTEDLMSALSKIDSLKVTARTSSFLYRNSTADARAIGDSLRVTYLLEGSWQRIDSLLRIRVRLVDTRTGTAEWTHTYDRRLEDVFDVQSDIARSVARELNLHLAPSAEQKLRRGPTQNIAAWDLYIRGRDPARLRSDTAATTGRTMLRQAIALDSTFAAAYAALPYMYISAIGRAQNIQRARELLAESEAAGRKAVALDPSLPEAHAGLGIALMMKYSEVRVAEQKFRTALELGGVSRYREHLAQTAMYSGRSAEFLTEARRAVDGDPVSPTAAADLGLALCLNQRYDEGLTQLKKLDALVPPLGRLKPYRAVCYTAQGRWSEALAQFGPDGPTIDPWSSIRGYVLARSGAVTEARQMQSVWMARWRETGRGATRVALTALGLGDMDMAFEWLDRTDGDLHGSASVMYPFFSRLHADPRFERYRKQIGLQKR